MFFLSLSILQANYGQKQKLPKFTQNFGPNIDRKSKNIFQNNKNPHSVNKYHPYKHFLKISSCWHNI